MHPPGAARSRGILQAALGSILLFSAGAARGAAPAVPGTGVPWLNELPSTGTAIYRGVPGTPIRAAGTLRLCVIRVDFVEDFVSSTTGNGHFDMDAQPPHDTAYSVQLLEEMAGYVEDVSGGLMTVDFSVFPGSGAYRMGHQMAWYGADSVGMAGPCMLLRDAVEASDQEVDFSAFDAVMVIHAGAGQEADIYGNSPDDLPSVFITLADLAYYLPEGGIGYQGIETDDGVLVQEGMLDPEQETQDGFGLGVLGTMVHELMHQLGLPDLYDTMTGGVGVGGWDIMGYGQWMMSGYWPTGPGAWSRVRLGWAQQVTLDEGGTFTAASPDTVYRVRLSGSEYLLVENRQRDPDGDGQCGAHERDFGLHGSGILIWHVDNGVVDSNFGSNTINADPAHKGVDLEEADGIQDFDYSLPDIYGIEGSEFDPWFSGGYGELFDPWSTPPSCTSWGGLTGVSIEVLDPPQGSMSFVLDPGLMPDGWPLAFGPLMSGPVPRATSSGISLVFTSTVGILWEVMPFSPDASALASGALLPPLAASFDGSGELFGWCADDGLHLVDPSGDEMPGWPVSGLSGSPVAAMLCPGLDAFVVATDRKLVYCISLDGEVMPGWPGSFSEQPAGLCLVPSEDGFQLALLTVSGEAFAWNPDGSPVGGWPVSAAGGEPCGAPLSSDLDRDGSAEIAFLCGSTLSLYGSGGDVEQGFPVQLRGEPCGSPWLADMNSDGYPEVLVETSLGIEAFEASGAVLSDWPDAIEGDPDSFDWSRLSSGAGAQSFTGFFLRDGRTYLCGPQGEPLEGFPVSTGDSPVGRPLLADLDADGDLDLCAADASGWAGLWGTAIPDPGWFPGADHSGSNCWPEELLPGVTQTAALLLPGSFFTYPNPARGDAATIRFEPGSDCSYRVRVFDVAGELVSDFSGQCSGGVAHEVQWGVGDLSPGVYYVCLELDAPERREEALFHAAVVH